MVSSQSHLGSAGEVEVISGQVIDLVRVFIEEARTAHDCGRDQGRGHHRGEACSNSLIHRHGHKSQFQAGTHTGQVVEARARNLRTALDVNGAQSLTQRQMVLRFKTFCSEVTGVTALVTEHNEIFFTAGGNTIQDEVGQEASQTVSFSTGLIGACFGSLDLFCKFLCLSQDGGALFRGGLAN